jgi:Ion channel
MNDSQDLDDVTGRERYGLLLAAILAAFFVQGIASPGAVEQVLVTVLLAATLLLALWAADSRRAVIRLAVVVATVVVVFSAVESASNDIGGAAYRLANLLLVVLAPPAIVIGVVRNMRARSQVTVQAVFGVLCLYLLLGMFFAFIYGAMDRFNPHFFANGAEATVARCLYFSFTTLTTVGYGDYTASSNLGHTLSVTEGLLGQIYLVTIVSLIVGNLRRRT